MNKPRKLWLGVEFIVLMLLLMTLVVSMIHLIAMLAESRNVSRQAFLKDFLPEIRFNVAGQVVVWIDFLFRVIERWEKSVPQRPYEIEIPGEFHGRQGMKMPNRSPTSK